MSTNTFVLQGDHLSWLDAPYPRQTPTQTHTGHTITAWVIGELLTYRGQSENSLARLVADFEADRVDLPSLNGRFVLVIKTEAEWQIITDRVGSAHVYYALDDDKICAVGNDLAAVAALSPHADLDWLGIASFFTFGFFLDDRTYYDHVRVMWPASVYRLSAAGVLLGHVRYWTWHHTPDTTRTYDETLEIYDSLFRQAVARCATSERLLLPLSGGLDSRSLAAVLPGTAQTFSYGYTQPSVETRIASQVARAANLPYTEFVMPAYLFDHLPEIVRALHGAQDVTQARQTSVFEWMQAQGEVVLTGLWGDVWCDQMGLADGLPAGYDFEAYAFKKLAKRGHDWLLDNVVAQHLPNACDVLKQHLADGIAEFASIVDDDFRLKAYKTSRWAFRWSNASLRGHAMGAVPRIPYYDVDLIDFFLTVPTAYVRDRRLQIDHLKRYAPALAQVAWQQTRSSLFTEQFIDARRFAAIALNKLQRMLLSVPSYQRNWEVQFFALGGRERLTESLGDLSAFGVRQGAVEGLLADLYTNPNAHNGYSASLLLTFAAWMETRA